MELRCKCGRLLAKRVGTRIEIKRKDLLLYVTGKAEIICPKCGVVNTVES